MTDHDAIRETLTLYCHAVDDGRFDDFAELFAEDATFRVMGEVHEGRDAIRDWMQEVQPPELRGKHVGLNPVIRIDGDEATAVTDYIFVSRQADGFAVSSAGRYHDRLRRAGERWVFVDRQIVFMGDEPLPAP
ncbi:MAG: hypothetical protein JJLCMIEE_00757 [Acidimicrobiales bacterium]|nr:hypothetical protein [Acidimicrobiales bacterium]